MHDPLLSPTSSMTQSDSVFRRPSVMLRSTMRSDRMGRSKSIFQDPAYEVAQYIRRLKSDRYVLLPTSRFLCHWDVFIFACVITTGFFEPYQEVLGFRTSFGEILNVVLQLAFITDTAMHFFRAKRKTTRNGTVLVTALPELATQYLQGRFIVDFLSSFPFSWVFVLLQIQLDCSLLRLLRFLRLTRLNELFARLQVLTAISFSVINIVEFALVCTMVLHWIACLWVLFGLRGNESWLTKAQDNLTFFEVIFQGQADTTNIYLLSLYWSVTVVSSVGFGDITPVNRGEFICATLCMMLGGSVWAYIIGNVCGIVATTNKHRLAFESTMNDVNLVCSEQRFPPDLQERVLLFYRHSEEFMRMKQCQDTMGELSPGLKSEVFWWMYGCCFKRVWYLSDIETSSASVLIEGMSPKMYAPQEWIEASVDGVRALIFLRSGLCVRKCNLLSPGSVWGTDVILSNPEHDHIEELLDRCLARSVNFVFVLRLSKQCLDHTMELFPEFGRKLRRARLRMLVWRGVIAVARGIKRIRKQKLQPDKLSRWEVLGKTIAKDVDQVYDRQADTEDDVVPDHKVQMNPGMWTRTSSISSQYREMGSSDDLGDGMALRTSRGSQRSIERLTPEGRPSPLTRNTSDEEEPSMGHTGTESFQVALLAAPRRENGELSSSRLASTIAEKSSGWTRTVTIQSAASSMEPGHHGSKSQSEREICQRLDAQQTEVHEMRRDLGELRGVVIRLLSESSEQTRLLREISLQLDSGEQTPCRNSASRDDVS